MRYIRNILAACFAAMVCFTILGLPALWVATKVIEDPIRAAVIASAVTFLLTSGWCFMSWLTENSEGRKGPNE